MTHRWTQADEARWRQLGEMIARAIERPPSDPRSSKLERTLRQAMKWPFPTADRARWPQLATLIKAAHTVCLVPPHLFEALAAPLQAEADLLLPEFAGEPAEPRPAWWVD